VRERLSAQLALAAFIESVNDVASILSVDILLAACFGDFGASRVELSGDELVLYEVTALPNGRVLSEPIDALGIVLSERFMARWMLNVGDEHLSAYKTGEDADGVLWQIEGDEQPATDETDDEDYDELFYGAVDNEDA